MGIFSKEEIKALVISILVLAVVFGLDDKKPIFEFSYWIANFIRVVISVAVILFAREYSRKIIAKRFYAETEYKIWKIARFWFNKGAKLPIRIFGKTIKNLYIGIILPLFFSVASFGRFYLPVTGVFDVKEHISERVGRKYSRLTEFETAVIALGGVLANIFLVLVFSILNNFYNFEQFITINVWIALFSFLPFGELDGSKIFFNSILFYVLSLAFAVGVFILVPYFGLIATVILALLFALILTVVFFIFFEYK